MFLDPPDNLGVKYDGYEDRREPMAYLEWLMHVLWRSYELAPIVWLSHYYRHTPEVMRHAGVYVPGADLRLFLWRFTFGQHRGSDCGNGYRPILRVANPGTLWNTDAIRVPSARQRNGDKRADPRGRVPDDVWDFSRVCGTFKERHRWALNQHPEALLERIIKLSCDSGDLVVDPFAHSFTTARVCKRLDIDCISIEQSWLYCLNGAAELETKVIQAEDVATEFPPPAPGESQGKSHV